MIARISRNCFGDVPAMKKLAIQTAAFAGVLALLSGCNEHHGPVATETRPLTGFSAIDLEGAARVQITVGAPNALELEGPADILERIRTEVRGDTLVIDSRLRVWLRNTSARVTLRISTPELKALRLGGGNEIRIEGYSGGESSIKAEGAANISATGALDRVVVRMSGAGNVNLRDLVANDADVTVDGVGTVVVRATETLHATMNGVGTIHYLGNPRNVTTRMNGLGSISKADDAGGSRDEADELDPDNLQPEYEDPSRKNVSETEVV